MFFGCCFIALQSKSEAVLAGLMFGFLISFVLRFRPNILDRFSPRSMAFIFLGSVLLYVYCISSYSKIDNLIPPWFEAKSLMERFGSSVKLLGFDKKTLPTGSRRVEELRCISEAV